MVGENQGAEAADMSLGPGNLRAPLEGAGDSRRPARVRGLWGRARILAKDVQSIKQNFQF